MLVQVFILTGLIYLTQGKDCKDITKPHQTRCDMYFKCVVLPSKNIAWIPTKCNRGLIYESNLKMCVVPDANWECTLGDEKEPTKTDDNNVYGVNNLDYLNKEIQSYRPKYDENGEKVQTDSDNDNESSDGEEKIVVVSSEDIDNIDGNNIEIIDDYTTPNESEVNSNDEVDYSGDGSDGSVDNKNDIVENKETYIAIPVNSDPNKSVASHLQRLSQLIQSLKDSQLNKSQNYDLGPNELNNFLAHHNIKVEYNDQLKNQKKKQEIPMDGRIHPDHLSQILDLQQKLQSLNDLQNGEYVTTTAHPTQLADYPITTRIQIKGSNPVKNVRITDPGYSSSQIVVNRPEGSVVFSLPNNAPQSQYPLQSQYPPPAPPPPPPPPPQQEPYVSQDTLKTVLELSKQLISSSNHQQAIQNYIPEQNYLQPIFRPIYYNIPIHELPVPIINNYEKKEPKHEDSKDHESNGESNYEKIASVSGFVDTTPKYQTENDDKPDEHSTIIHNHIPITIENPFQSNKKSSKVSGPTVAPVTAAPAAMYQFDDYKPYSDVYNSRPYRPYPEFNEGGQSAYAAYLTQQQLPNSNPSYSLQYAPQPNQQNSGSYYLQQSQQGQPYQQQFLQNHQFPANEFPQSFYTQQTHLNDNNVNKFVNFNTPQYPTLRPASLSSLTSTDPVYAYPNQMNAVTPKLEPINTYQAFHSLDEKKDQDDVSITDSGDDDDDDVGDDVGDDVDDEGHGEYDSTGNEEFDEEDNIAADLNESNVMNLLADLQNQKMPAIQNKQLPERAPINPLLSGANDDTKRKVVQLGDNFMSISEYEKLVQPLIDRDALADNLVDIIPCVTGARQPLAKDCTKYIVCNGDTSKVLTYSCPPYTAFNPQSRFCDAKTFGICKKGAMPNKQSPSSLDLINANKRLQYQADKELELAQKERDQAVKTQQLTALIKQQTQNILNARPPSPQRPVRHRRKKVKVTTSAPRPFYRTRPTKKRKKNPPRIRRIPCREPSKVADKLSIYNYFNCYKGKDGMLKAIKMTCPAGLIFCGRSRLCTSAARCAA